MKPISKIEFVSLLLETDYRHNLKLSASNTHLANTVQDIFNEVSTKGDQAIIDYTQEFDRVKLDQVKALRLDPIKLTKLISDKQKAAINLAIANIESFHRHQLVNGDSDKIETFEGITCWRKCVPLNRIGIYVPGGTAPLVSSLIMCAVAAKVAGCKEIAVTTPPTLSGTIHPAIDYTLNILGLDEVYSIGGAQAICALALGTESIKAVDKIVGPGNSYVNQAKKLVLGLGVPIDLPAGPSEVAIIVDHTCNPAFTAIDLLSQAEHDPESQVLLICLPNAPIELITSELDKLLLELPRQKIANASIDNGYYVMVDTEDEALQLINSYAPEHLIIQTTNPEALALGVKNCGSVFIGNYTPESLGDYASGTNHVLPTSGFAKSWSGLSVNSFHKWISFQTATAKGLQGLGETVVELAELEGLQAHSNAVKIRLAELAKLGL